MPLQKQGVPINFQQGLDLKTDPNQLPVGKFVELVNTVYDKIGRLTKRNGFGDITSLPDGSSRFVTTFNGSLTAIGTDLKAFSPGAGLWVNRGLITPLQLSTLPLVRNNTNQSYVDAVTSQNGLVCTVYTDNVTAGSQTLAVAKYAIADLESGQNLSAPAALTSSFGTVSAQARVFSLNKYFIIAFASTDGATFRLQYAPVNIFNPQVLGSVTTISSSYRPSTIGSSISFDGVVANNSLYLSWNSSSSSGVRAASISQNLSLSTVFVISSASAAKTISVASDVTGTTPVIWTSFFDGTNAYTVATNQNIGTLFSTATITSSASGQIINIAQTAQGGVDTILFERTNAYTYDSNVATNFITRQQVYQTGSVSASNVFVRSLGLASKGFLIGSSSYAWGSYSSPYQPSYFLIDSSGGEIAKLAYSNGGGYLPYGLPSVSVSSSSASIGYLFKDSIQAVNKDTNVATGTQVNGIYSQLGVNFATASFGTSGLTTTEIGNNLNINGGFLWSYDGLSAVEQGFHVYPDSVEVNTTASGTSAIGISAQTYYYQATYEWTDNQGNAFRSAPSIPVSLTISSGTVRDIIVNVPTLRLTRKTQNPVKIVLYRWSTAQQVYYQVTSINQPILNNLSVDSISFKDTNSDATILGNNIIYTNGGVVENIGGPAATGTTLFDSRHWQINAEDQNVLSYSKQVIEATPVELSDLFTLFVSPNAGAQGNTGPMKCLAPMDDKLIIFKKNAIYYLNGAGPDNTGANSQYSQPTFITSTLGCDNPNSIVTVPSGLMFQSDKGIWLLGRDLSTSYIGWDVEDFNDDEVVSALTIPDAHEVRFTMASGAILLYDYSFNQWGSFRGAPGISACIYENLHTFINSRGEAFQETPGTYFDGSTPVVMNFKTGWINLAGLQGYKRVYRMYVLGEYKSPHKLTLGVAYDYSPQVTQQSTITPDNFADTWGSDATWGDSVVWGGPSSKEQWRVNFEQQQCQSFQITFNEYYDPTLGVPAGEGLTLSGLTLVAGIKGSSPENISKDHTVG